jgi:CopG family transcriptional regulator, nickel-responsive regulator
MERFTVSLDGELLAQFDEYIHRRGYGNRSEAVRDILRGALEGQRLADDDSGHCVACLSYIYNHHERELARRLTQASHQHHDLTLSTLHVHLDHENCMEVSILRGQSGAVRAFADSITAETGVRHGTLNAVPVDHHDHDHGHDHAHVHSSPKT